MNMPIFLLGDTILDLLHAAKPGVYQYMNMLQDFNLNQLIKEPTYPAATPSLLDHIITDVPEIETKSRVVAVNISDHHLIQLEIPFHRIKQKPRERTVRSTKDSDFNHLCHDLLQANWSPLYAATTIDAKYDAFLQVWNHNRTTLPGEDGMFLLPSLPVAHR